MVARADPVLPNEHVAATREHCLQPSLCARQLQVCWEGHGTFGSSVSSSNKYPCLSLSFQNGSRSVSLPQSLRMRFYLLESRRIAPATTLPSSCNTATAAQYRSAPVFFASNELLDPVPFNCAPAATTHGFSSSVDRRKQRSICNQPARNRLRAIVAKCHSPVLVRPPSPFCPAQRLVKQHTTMVRHFIDSLYHV